MKVTKTEYRGGGFYGNRPPRIVREEERRIGDDDGLCASFAPVRWEEIAKPPKPRRGKRGG